MTTATIPATDFLSRALLLPVSVLVPRPGNPRTHSKKQIRQIAESIRTFGFTNPVLVDDENGIVAGHGRVEAAKLLKMEAVPAIRLAGLSEARIRAYVITDNRLAELAGWDEALLKIEFAYLAELDLDFDLTVTGFDLGEIEMILDDAGDPAAPVDILPPPDTGPPVSRPGDLWILGNHRLLCGDARDPAAYERLMAGEAAQMVFTDPPYNVPIAGHVCGLGSVKHDEFAMASGEMTKPEFTAFLKSVLARLAASSADGSIHFVCMDWRHMGELLGAADGVYAELKNLCVWNKANGGMGSFYRSKHELVFVFKHGTAPHINTFELGQHGRYRSNVWDYAGISGFKAERAEELAMHPTVKPVALVADAIKDCSRKNGIVLDAFSGSGTTIIAAETTGRRGYALEIDPAYVDVAVRRWQLLTGEEAVLDGDGRTFGEIQAARTAETPQASVTPDSPITLMMEATHV